MRASRRFLPSSMPALEGRVVPSQMGLRPGEFRPVQLTSAEIAQSNASEKSFGLSVSATIHAGLPVAEQLTTRYSDGLGLSSTQTESLLKVPNPANNTVTSYETLNLRDNGGTKTVVDTVSFSGGTTPFSGDDNTNTATITLPDGSTESETYHVVITGNKTVVTGTLDEADGGVETWTADKVKHGPTTTNNRTITEPDGTIEYQRIVTTNHGDLDSTATSTTRIPSKDSIEYSSSATQTIRVQPPSS
jgi:hypothetical protein